MLTTLSLHRTVDVYERGRAAGQHEGLQLAVMLHGAPVVDLALGLAKGEVPMQSDSLVIWFSTSKIVTAVAVAQLWERDHLRLDTPIAEYLPEFGMHGKDVVTVRHVLTHTGGFRNADGMLLGWDAEVTMPELYARVCAAGLEEGWRPGIDAGYHASAGHVVLGELVSRLSGSPYELYVREHVLEPVGAHDWWVGVPSDKQADYGDRLASMWWCQDGLHGEAPGFETVACRERAHPGMGGRGPANQLVLLLEALRLDASGERAPSLVRPQTWEAVTARHRAGVLDRTFQKPLDWGLGVIPATRSVSGEPVAYGYGAHCGPRTWGHSGAQSSTGFVDPDNELCVALMINGMPGHGEHTKRQHELLTALYEDLQLT